MFLILSLLSIPMPYAVNGIAVGLFALVTIICCKKANIRIERALVYPVLLYLLMAASIIWSHDKEATTRAISKVLPLLVLPACFIIGPRYSLNQKRKIMMFYSYGILLYCIFYLVKALVNYIETNDFSTFFYHKLVTEDVNAIHVSIYAALAFFWFFTKNEKRTFDKLAMFLLAIFIVLLSSKNVILMLVVLMIFYEIFYFKATQKIKWITLGLLVLLSATMLFSSKIRDRFLVEFKSNQQEGTINTDFGPQGKVYNVSIKQAWEKEHFEQNEYFPGAAFRVYQFRIFTEMLHEDDIFFTGYGLNATDFRIEQKGLEHTVFSGNGENEGYQKKNFHNQYVQLFAETGVFGFLLLLIIVFVNLKNAFKTKDFVHISFAILMISLFLTESFLARQRGVVFFAAIYCLFNSGIALKSRDKE
ncbi:O-antigen ligase family protein [Flavobacterium pallidum]|uniref:O-antigen ligase family protein n=1 Tax=Flavobacterium pallidum TaxID=2172098 RepID=UPI0015E7E771|nr:O-antigen ligase family protein [Flavobacterium pallidum]